MRKVSWFAIDLVSMVIGCRYAAASENAIKGLVWWFIRLRYGKSATARGPFRWRVARVMRRGGGRVVRSTVADYRLAVGSSIDGVVFESAVVRKVRCCEDELWAVLDAFLKGFFVRGDRSSDVTGENACWELKQMVFRSSKGRNLWYQRARELESQIEKERFHRNYEEREVLSQLPSVAIDIQHETLMREVRRRLSFTYVAPPPGTTPVQRVQTLVESIELFMRELDAVE